jgi:dihydrofolate synthase/folylpolyglutamate synthase
MSSRLRPGARLHWRDADDSHDAPLCETAMTPVDAILARLLELHPKKIDLSLDRIRRILERLGHPEARLPPVIHVAGTNGKGSVIAFMRAILEASGRSAHVYTSPHLVRFNERFRIGAPGGGTLVADVELAAVLAECERVNDNAPITVFEMETAAAFVLFARHPADALLLEVGLGGRLDATNVIERPLATVVTPISVDHVDYLGSSIEGIAREKAGIFRRKVPALVAPQPRDALRVIEREAARLSAPLKIAGEDWIATEERGRLVYQDDDGLLDLPAPRLFGRHQFDNAGVAIAALRAVSELKLPTSAFEEGLAKVDWPARLQRLSHGHLMSLAPPGSELWLDGRSGGTRGASARPHRRHAVDQGQRGLPAQFHRACAPRDRGPDCGPGKVAAARCDRRGGAARRDSGRQPARHRRGACRRRAARARSTAAHSDHRLALSRGRSAGAERHRAAIGCRRDAANSLKQGI